MFLKSYIQLISINSCILFIIVTTCTTTNAQSKASIKEVQRYEINAKRIGVDESSEDALPRSREFKRIDSSYYVGWLYEGYYKYTHAADYIGYKSATPALEKALFLIERDYPKELQTHTNDIINYYPIYRFQLDYSRIAYALKDCYANTEQPDKVITLARRVLKWKFQRDYYFDSYNILAWTVHRYRFKKNKDYYFLRNTIDENEKLAMSYLDTGLFVIQKNKKYNDGLFMPGYETNDRMSVYHYKSMLYGYALKTDSAQRYYDLMRDNGVLPHNNYANFLSICGKFENAKQEYEQASQIENSDKRLQEWAYYSTILDIAKHDLDTGIKSAKNMINNYGSSPGFGWYNIALARCYTYSGLLEKAQYTINKAVNFKELHIGTTLGQSHYEFSAQLQKLIILEKKLAAIKFEDKYWWIKPTKLFEYAKNYVTKSIQQYVTVNQLALNPERDRVIYKLFSTESTVLWDEIWYLIKDFSSTFFINQFKKELDSNKRPIIQKYFELFISQFYIKQGKSEEALKMLTKALNDTNINTTYEKLFMARCYESIALANKEIDNIKQYNYFSFLALKAYPQLVPFSKIKPKIYINSTNLPSQLLRDLSRYNIDFVNIKDQYTAIANIQLINQQDGSIVFTSSMTDSQGLNIVPLHSFTCNKKDNLAKEIAYQIFGIDTKLY